MTPERVAVVIADAVEPRTATQTRKEQRPVRRPHPPALGLVVREPLVEVFGGSLRIAQVELHDQALAQRRRDRQRARVWVGGRHVADQEVAAPVRREIRTHLDAEKERRLQQCAIARIGALEEVADHLQRRTPVHLDEHVVIARARHEHRLSDRAASLRDDAVHPHVALERDADEPVTVDAIPEEERVLAGAFRPAGETTDHRAVREVGVQLPHQRLGVAAPRVGEEHEVGIRRRGDLEMLAPRIDAAGNPSPATRIGRNATPASVRR